MEPTIEELNIAWTIAIKLQNVPSFPGEFSGAILDLKRIRDRKTTWFGECENKFRFSIDSYLRDKGME